MSDINFLVTNNIDSGYGIEIGESGSSVSGNMALLNRFQITFFDEGMGVTVEGGETITDDYGGRAFSLIGAPRALSDSQSITGSITAAVKNTVDSIKSSTPDNVKDTERLDKATLVGISVVKDVVTATIDVYPVELESFNVPRFNIPIISK